MSFETNFRDPDHKYGVNNLWFLNGKLKPEKLRQQIREMADKGVYHAFMHPRAYLKTPYLEQEWWDAIDACVDEGEKQDFYPWLYDEYAWPSGTAGSTFEYSYQKHSRVLEHCKDYAAKSLFCEEWDVPSAQELSRRLAERPEKLLGLYQVENGAVHRLANPESLSASGRVTVFFEKENPVNVDYLNPDVIREFIRVTHEEYKKRYGQYFGNRIPGVFFDEIYMQTQPLPWTEKLPQVFRQRHGYDLLNYLPWLMEEGGEQAQKVRTDYYETTSYLYETSFFAQIGDWCTENHLKLTGHTEEDLGRHPARQGSYFDTMRHLHIPGADNHDYRYRFPRKITYCEPKYSVSVSRVNGYDSALSEAMGGAGWGCSLQTFKRGINTMAAMGINFFTLHGFYYSCEHQGSQGDWPTSFFYQNPYWKYFKQFADYIRRVSYINTIGTPKVDVGLFYPVDEIRRHAVAGRMNREGQRLVDGFHTILNTLVENQMDVDYIDRTAILGGNVQDGQLCAGKEAFSVLVLPDTLVWEENLEKKLQEFVQAGGRLLFYRAGSEGMIPQAFAASPVLEAKEVCPYILKYCDPDIVVEQGQRWDFFANHRRIEGKDVYFLTNSAPERREYTLRLKGMGSAAVLDPETGEERRIHAECRDGYTYVRMTFQEDQAVFVVLGAVSAKPGYVLSNRRQYSVPGRWDFLPCPNSEHPRDVWNSRASELYIPLATFSSSLHKESRRIRIQNTAWEEGYCGRHLSLWNAKMITRRTAWKDDSNKKDLYFRKVLSLDSAARSARICMAAVNEYELFINGNLVCQSQNNSVPETVDICRYLTVGENLLAVHVHNENNLAVGELNSIDYLPQGRMISLLLEGEIETETGTVRVESDESFIVCDRLQEGWNQLQADFEAQARRINHSASGGIVRFDRDGMWVNAWSRGNLPLHPWGDLPLQGKTLQFPVDIAYTVTLPAGTHILHRPAVQGECRFLLDSMPFVWDGDTYELGVDGNTHTLSIQMQAQCAEDGLKKPVHVTMSPFETSLNDWRLFGLDWFAGDGVYRIETEFRKDGGRYFLNLGKTAFTARVWVNGKYAGVRVWEPYQYDVTDLLQDGVNEILVSVSNSAAVERQFMLVDEGRALGWDMQWNSDNIHREGENLVSGLLGTVLIEQYDVCKLED